MTAGKGDVGRVPCSLCQIPCRSETVGPGFGQIFLGLVLYGLTHLPQFHLSILVFSSFGIVAEMLESVRPITVVGALVHRCAEVFDVWSMKPRDDTTRKELHRHAVKSC